MQQAAAHVTSDVENGNENHLKSNYFELCERKWHAILELWYNSLFLPHVK